MARPWRLFAIVVISLAGLAAAATAPQAALSERVVVYKIEARLDVAKKTLDATETLTYRNLTGRALDTFPFHLYLNAFQPKSSFLRERRQDRPEWKWDDKNYGAIAIKSFEVVGMGDLTPQLGFIHPDDGNADDRSVIEVKLPRPVLPGAEVQFRIAFQDKFPEVFERTGYKHNFFMGGQWFPKVGVWWHGAWNCHQFHANTEFFADFGVYDVSLTLPQNFVVGASGVEVSSTNHGDGTKTVRFRGEDIHDFAWTADPNYRVVEDAYGGSAGQVKIRLLMQPGHMHQAARHLRILKAAMERFDHWYGPYPYPQLTAVDPPRGAMGAAGMEYPTLITMGTLWWIPDGVHYPFPEIAAEHEFGHQYWYGMVASNEFEEPWLDEGINTYAEIKVMDSLYGRDTSAMNTRVMSAGDAGLEHWSYRLSAETDPLTRPGWKFMTGASYGRISYGKSAMMLLTLEKIIGEETLRRALRTYFMHFRFRHPTTEDLLSTIEEVSGRNLRWFFDQAVYGTQVLDYEVLKITSVPADAFEKNPPKEKKGATIYSSNVLVHRKGDFIFPVEVEVKFDDGQTVRESWDGRDRWVRFTYERKASVVSAEIDPEHQVWLDRDRFNNSRTAEPETGAKRKLRAYWILAVQFFSQMLAWLA